jgi:hypothetical protein
MFFRAWSEARGFSGFELDEQFSGDYALINSDYSLEYLQARKPWVFNSEGSLKEFRHPRTLLEMQHPYHKGKPLFTNEAHNILMFGSRDTGKTYMVGVGLVLHQ